MLRTLPFTPAIPASCLHMFSQYGDDWFIWNIPSIRVMSLYIIVIFFSISSYVFQFRIPSLILDCSIFVISHMYILVHVCVSYSIIIFGQIIISGILINFDKEKYWFPFIQVQNSPNLNLATRMQIAREEFKVTASSLKLEIRLHIHEVETNTWFGIEVMFVRSSDWLMHSELL